MDEKKVTTQNQDTAKQHQQPSVFLKGEKFMDDEKKVTTQNQDTTEASAESKAEQETTDVPKKEEETLVASLKKKVAKVIAWTTAHKKELIYMGVGFAAGTIFGVRYAGKSPKTSVANVARTVANTVSGSPYTTSYRYSSPASDPVAAIAVRLVKEVLK